MNTASLIADNSTPVSTVNSKETKMKVAALLLAALVACASAAVPMPIEAKNEELDAFNTPFILEGIITDALDGVINSIIEAGLDPFVIDQFEIGYELPVPILFSGSASLTNLRVSGVSNIVIHNINYALLTSRLTLDVSLPAIEILLGDASFDVTLLGHNFAGRTSSRIAVVNPGIKGEVRMNVGVITGISVRNVDLQFYHDRMEYNGFVELFGYDLTPLVSRIVNDELSNSLRALDKEISQLMDIVIRQVVDELL